MTTSQQIRIITTTITRDAPSVITSPDDVKRLYWAANPNGRWFDAETMKWWSTRLMSAVFSDGHNGAYFVTSERTWESHTERAYTLRHIDRDGQIATVGDLGIYTYRAQAVKDAREAARKAASRD